MFVKTISCYTVPLKWETVCIRHVASAKKTCHLVHEMEVLTDSLCVSLLDSLCPPPLPDSNLSDHQKKVWQVPLDHNLPGGQASITLPLPSFSLNVCTERSNSIGS
jgi:hypothetical protein